MQTDTSDCDRRPSEFESQRLKLSVRNLLGATSAVLRYPLWFGSSVEKICGVVAVVPAALSCVLFIDAAVCGTADCAPVTPFCGVVIGTPEGVIAGRCPAVVFVVGDAVGFTIGVEFGFGVGVVIPVGVVVDVLGLTIGLDVGFGFGLEFGFGVGADVTGVDVAAAELTELPDVDGLFDAAAGLVFVALELDDALFEFVELEFVALLLVLPLEPVDPALPPVVCATETAAMEPISSAAIVFEREMCISPPCRTRTVLEDVRKQVNQDEQAGRNAEQPSDEILTHTSSVIDK